MPERKKGLALASLILGLLSLPTLGLLLVGAMASIVLGVVALVKANRQPAEYGGQALALCGIGASVLSITLMPFVLGIAAAIAIPSLLRARVAANEAAAIGDIRAMLAAQEAYKAANGGFYDTPVCLSAPGRCIPDYKGAPFLDAAIASRAEHSGYAREFRAGPAPDLERLRALRALSGPASRSSLTFYAYVVTPLAHGQTGVRGFCADASGRICVTHDGSAPETVEGMCPADCTVLQ
jgi:hypothetical protein